MKLVLTLFSILTFTASLAQTPLPVDSLTRVLEKVMDDDQLFRKDFSNILSMHARDTAFMIDWIHKMNVQDSINEEIVSRIIDQYGWIKKEKTSEKASNTQFMVIQHAPIGYQVKYLSTVKKAMLTGEVKKSDYAILSDRTNMRLGKYQVYGSQINYDANGHILIYPIADEPNVDTRRKKIGLPAMKEYLKMFDPGFNYILPHTDPIRAKKVILGSTKSAGKPMIIAGVNIYYNQSLLGQSNSSGFFQIPIDKKLAGKMISFEKSGFKKLVLKIPATNQDVFELTPYLQAAE